MVFLQLTACTSMTSESRHWETTRYHNRNPYSFCLQKNRLHPAWADFTAWKGEESRCLPWFMFLFWLMSVVITSTSAPNCCSIVTSSGVRQDIVKKVRRVFSAARYAPVCQANPALLPFPPDPLPVPRSSRSSFKAGSRAFSASRFAYRRPDSRTQDSKRWDLKRCKKPGPLFKKFIASGSAMINQSCVSWTVWTPSNDTTLSRKTWKKSYRNKQPN
jgi:hypothetical protein